MQHTFINLVFAVAIMTAVIITAACSSTEVPAADSGAALQPQSVPEEAAPAATPTPQPTATAPETTLKTEIIEEPVSPISTAASPAQAAPDENAMQLPDTLPPGSETAVTAAIANLSQQQGIDPAEITVAAVESTEWSDASLGCPQEGFMYAQVITPGFLVTLQAHGETFEYHTDQNDHVVLCQP